MKSSTGSRIRTTVRITGLLLAFSTIAATVTFLILFPGTQRSIAFTLATGIGTGEMQAMVDKVESKVVAGVGLSDAEKAFLRDLYTCFAKGGKASLAARQSADMMFRYLSGSGEDLRTDPRIFLRSGPVREEMTAIRVRILDDLRNRRISDDPYSSEEFYMGDPDYFDAAVGLYFGHVEARVEAHDDETLRIVWRAECPWEWPSYDELYERYGRHGAQRFAIPNVRSVITGRRADCLLIGDGLGGHLAEIALAKPFLVYSEWTEEIPYNPGH